MSTPGPQIPGPQVHQLLIAAYDRSATRLEDLRSRASRFEETQDQLEDTRNQSLRQLAEYYLPDLTGDSIDRTWSEIRPTMREILLRKQNRLRELQEQLEDHRLARSHLQNSLAEISTRLDD